MAGIGTRKIESNPVKVAMAAGQATVGGWLTFCSPVVAEAMAPLGFDWIAVDIQHSPVSWDTTVNCFRAIQLGGGVPMARIPWNEPVWIQRTLDAGAMGLIIPMINTEADAVQAVSNMRYSPGGQRSYGGSRLRPYVDGDWKTWSDDNMLCVVMIETVEAVRNAEAILSVEGVDACFIGPVDLALSMGISLAEVGPGTEHEAMLQQVLATGKRVGTPVGKHCNDGAEVRIRIAQGFQFLACANDVRFMTKQAQDELAVVGTARQASSGLKKGELY
ncbi:MAG: 2-dehydro-3-deoxyglucarate aldolase [Chloroflexi bacterium]|nr:2-dehydro-3-deoxyglucarate aldolase [Chloroflexota bacterium]